MKKLAVLITAAAFMAVLFPMALAGEEAQQTPDNSSQEVVVKGQLKIKIETDRPEIEIKTDVNKVAQSIISTEENFLAVSPEDLKDVKASLPDAIYEERTDYHASLSFLETPPIFRIVPKTLQGIDIDKWNFKVTDSTGGTVKLDRGDGSLPSELKWDGYDRDGNMLKVGSPYWYVLTYVDKAGNPATVRRETPKEVTAIKYKRDNRLFIEVTAKALFDAKRKERLTDDGKQMLLEIQDYMKMNNNFPVTVRVYSEDAGLAKDQIISLSKVFENSLKVPKDFFKMEPYQDNSIPKNYRVVFIING